MRLNINAISGGQPDGGIQTPRVADRCHAIFASSRSLRALGPDTRAPGANGSASARVQAMTASVKGCHRGPGRASHRKAGTCDQKHAMRMGLVEQCIAYGPGTLDQAHQPDEYCRIDHLVQGAKAMALAAMRLTGEAG